MTSHRHDPGPLTLAASRLATRMTTPRKTGLSFIASCVMPLCWLVLALAIVTLSGDVDPVEILTGVLSQPSQASGQ